MSPPRFPSAIPIVQAPMAGVQDSKLTIAIAKAGGVGSLPCAMLTPQQLEQELGKISDAAIENYNLNFFCHRAPEPDPGRESRWRQLLEPYYREYGVDPNAIPSGPGRMPFCAETLELLHPLKPPIVSFHFGLPAAEWVEAIKAWGGQVWSSATTLQEAKWLERHGADVLIAQGIEAGGHRGMFLTEDLATQKGTGELLDLLSAEIDLPVVAAGGIATAERAKQLLDQGAWAVQLGTAFLCCNEVSISPMHKGMLLDRSNQKTALTNLLSGRPARGLINRLMEDLGPMSDSTPEFPLAAMALAPLRAAAESQGRYDFSPLWCGTDTSGCHEVCAADHLKILFGQQAGI
ncbi:MAG: nitronate monooxygenase [Pseudomonadota bacterium]